MQTHIFGTLTEKQFHDTMVAIERKTEFDMWVELFKLGIITQNEFIRRAEIYVPHYHPKEKN